MELFTWVILLSLVAISWFLLSHKRDSNTNLPPGPLGLPIIGSPWLLFKKFHVEFQDMAKTWGPVFSVKIFGDRLVVLNTPEAVRDAYAGQNNWESFNGRPPAPLGNETLIHTTTFSQPSTQWSKQRRLVHKILNLYGEGLQETESAIQDELTHVTDYLQKKGELIDLNDVIDPSLINIITILLKGQRYEYESPVLKNVSKVDDTAARGADVRNNLILTIFPFLKYVPIGPGKYVIDLKRGTEQFNKDYYDESKATHNPNVTRGMIDFLFQHQKESRLPDGSVWLEDKHIKSIILEMVGAGSVTTRTALYSFFLIVAHKPEVAKKIQQEVDSIIGSSRFSKLDDRSNMPYTMAAIFELLRYISHVPLGLPHLVLDDVTFHGYRIPRNTLLMANTWLIHHDPKLWDDPWEFQPERFLDAEGHFLPADHIKRKNLIPFGIGRRTCVGETFARSRMFLFITTMLQRFDFRPDPAHPLPSCDPRNYTTGLVISPPSYHVSVSPRS